MSKRAAGKRRPILSAGLALYLSLVLFAGAGCGAPPSCKDGTYEGRSPVYEGGEDDNGAGYGVVVLTIRDQKITACEFHTYQPDGTLKDKNYGKKDGEIQNADFYNKAQRAVVACQKYAEKLLAEGSLKEVDVISGATISHNEFRDAVEDALAKARE